MFLASKMSGNQIMLYTLMLIHSFIIKTLKKSHLLLINDIFLLQILLKLIQIMIVILMKVILILLFMSDFWLDLMPVPWHPRRCWNVCMTEDEKKRNRTNFYREHFLTKDYTHRLDKVKLKCHDSFCCFGNSRYLYIVYTCYIHIYVYYIYIYI